MTKLIVITIAVASLSTTALAGTRAAGHKTHRQAVMAVDAGAGPGLLNANTGFNGNGNASDRAMYLRNLRDSGYDPKNDYNSNGLLVNQ